MTTEAKYSPGEVRRMIRWLMTINLRGTSLSIRSVDKLIDALDDNVILMLEQNGLFNQAEIEKRIDNYHEQ